MIRAFLFRVCVAAAVLLVFSASSELEAAPVAFAFEATVDQVAGNVGGLVQVAPGDVIHGSFTYEPTPFGMEVSR